MYKMRDTAAYGQTATPSAKPTMSYNKGPGYSGIGGT